MSGRHCQRLLTALVFAGLFVGTLDSVVADDALTIVNLPKNLFGGAEVTAQLAWKNKDLGQARVLWSLGAIDHRVLTRGEIDVPAGRQDLPIRIQLPAVKEGVILQLQFSAAVVTPQQTNPVAKVEQKLWLFPESPWVDRQQFLEQQKIVLFDPLESTAKLLSTAQVPFNETRNVASLGELSDGLILVGQGIDFREHPDLAGVLWSRAAAGRTVICLAPVAGVFSLMVGASHPTPTSLSFRREDVIAEFDERLDVSFGRSMGAATIRRFALRGEGSGGILEVTDDPAAWPWIEARFGPGRLLLCGFDFCECWQESPAARYFLAHLLMLRPVQNDPLKSERTEKR